MSYSYIYYGAVILALVGAFFIHKSNQKPSPESVGIGGWLILPIIGFLGELLFKFLWLLDTVRQIEAFKTIFRAEDAITKGVKIPILLVSTFNIALMVTAGICLCLIFARHSRVRHVAIFHYHVLRLCSIFELWANSAIRKALDAPFDAWMPTNAGVEIVGAAIWISYFHFSRRVRNTFEAGSMSLKAANSAPTPDQMAHPTNLRRSD